MLRRRADSRSVRAKIVGHGLSFPNSLSRPSSRTSPWIGDQTFLPSRAAPTRLTTSDVGVRRRARVEFEARALFDRRIRRDERRDDRVDAMDQQRDAMRVSGRRLSALERRGVGPTREQGSWMRRFAQFDAVSASARRRPAPRRRSCPRRFAGLTTAALPRGGVSRRRRGGGDDDTNGTRRRCGRGVRRRRGRTTRRCCTDLTPPTTPTAKARRSRRTRPVDESDAGTFRRRQQFHDAAWGAPTPPAAPAAFPGGSAWPRSRRPR